MPVLSIPNSPVESLNSVQLSVENFHRDYTAELQAAFETLDVHQICFLLDMGANPYQKIELNEKISYAMLKNQYKANVDVEMIVSQLNSLSTEDVLNKVENKELANRIIDMKSLLQIDRSSVSDEQLIDFATAVAMESSGDIQHREFPKFSAMALAITLQNFELMQKLVDAGFNFSDPIALATLRGYEYVVSASNPEGAQDESERISYTIELPTFLTDPNSPKLSVEEVFEKVQLLSPDGSLNSYSAQELLSLKKMGCLVEVSYKQLPILGAVTDCSDARIVMDAYGQTIDFLLEQGVARENILSFEDTFLEEPQHAIGNSDVLKFFLSRGFEVPGINVVMEYLKPWKNCWDPRTWGNKA